jgi:hypothetical protein
MLRRSSIGSTILVSRPLTTTVPALGSMTRLIIFNVVVFPQPDGPTMTQASPDLTFNDTSSTAVTLPNFFETSRSSIIAEGRDASMTPVNVP